MLLALDTSTAYVSVAVYDPDWLMVRAERNEVGPMRHAELLAPTITDCLAAADVAPQDLTGVVVGVGPGPYTGLRVGVVTALALADALGIEPLGVCSLDAIAAESGVPDPMVATSDARRKELFYAEYDAGQRLGDPMVAKPDQLDLAGRILTGVGHRLYPDVLPVAVAPLYPRAALLASLLARELVEVLDPEPIYLRRPDAVAPGAPKKVW